MMTERLLEEHPDPDEQQIRDYLAGNLCRCGTYPEVVKAVRSAARKMKDGGAARESAGA